MKLWLVVYMFGEIGGVAGPLPYDMVECRTRAAALQAGVAERIASGLNAKGNPITEAGRSLRFVCVESPSRPESGKPAHLADTGHMRWADLFLWLPLGEPIPRITAP